MKNLRTRIRNDA